MTFVAIMGASSLVCGVAAVLCLVLAAIDTIISDRADEEQMDDLIERQVKEEEIA